MASTKDFFLTVTKRVFSNWTALKMAVEHGMGTRDKANAFCQHITDVIYMNDGLNINEVACELEDYMDEQFNTELQDYSGNQVAEELLKFYRYCVQGQEALAASELEKLPPLQPWIVSYISRKSNDKTVVAQSDSDSESDETESNMEVEDTEWTEVKARRKR